MTTRSSGLSIERIQSYFREAARLQYEAVACPPFTAFFHQTLDFPFYNYAIPDFPVEGDLAEPLDRLVRLFRERRRLPRFEFVEAFAPALPAALDAAGFHRDHETWLMAATPQSFRPAPMPAGLVVESLGADVSDETLVDDFRVFRGAYGLDSTAPPTDDERASFRRTFGAGRGFLGRVDGEAVAVGQLLPAADRLAEVAAIGTLAPFRRRGFGAAITSAATRLAFERGCDAAVLMAASPEAGHVYEGCGYVGHGCVLMYAYPDR